LSGALSALFGRLQIASASPGEISAMLLLFAVAMVVLIVIDDDDLPGPRLCRVKAT
jgi:hypothetical protein